MQIQLKNIHVAGYLSQETTAFTADLYINSVKAAHCSNDGQGGATSYYPHALEHRVLITEAEEYCKELPAMPVPLGSEVVNVPMTLELYINNQVHKFLANNDRMKFERQKQRDMKKSILVGTDDKYDLYNFTKPLDVVINHGTNPVGAINEMIQKVLPKIKSGQRILNTNFPAGVIIPQSVNA